MKNIISILFLFLIFVPCFSQNFEFKYEKSNPSVKKEKLKDINFIRDISPQLWPKMALPSKEREKLEDRRRMYYPLGYYLYPQGGYDVIVEYVSMEISAKCNGKVLTSQSASNKLTIAQKNILNEANLGTDILISIQFKYKSQAGDKLNDNKIIEGTAVLTIVPEVEAEYPGGDKKITEYLTESIINKVSGISASEKLSRAVVKFSVNEEGKIIDAIIFRTSGDPAINKLILQAITKMPKWKPANDSKGLKVKQEFSIRFGGGC